MPRNELRYLRGLTGRLVGLIVDLTGNLAAENAMELLRDKKKIIIKPKTTTKCISVISRLCELLLSTK